MKKMIVDCKVNGLVEKQYKKPFIDSDFISKIKSEYGRFFYQSGKNISLVPLDVFSIEITVNDFTVLKLSRDENGTVLSRLDVKLDEYIYKI